MSRVSVRLLSATLLIAHAVSAQSPALSLEEKERFLETAGILSRKTLSEGITRSSRATLSDGRITHDAHIQTIDEFKQVFTSAAGTELNFQDSYRCNIAAYRLAKLLGIGHMVPPSVRRKVGGEWAAVTWWVDGVLMTEKDRFRNKTQPPQPNEWNQQMWIVRVFDQLIDNTDRNLGNLVIDKNWRLHMIDHTRAFRLHRRLRGPENLIRCDRQLLQALQDLDIDTLERDLRPLLEKSAIAPILARRDAIVKHFEEKIKRSSEAAVLYDYLSTR